MDKSSTLTLFDLNAMEYNLTLALLETPVPFFSCCFSNAAFSAVLGQQSEQGDLDTPLLGRCHQLLWGDTEAFPCQL